MIYVLKHNNIIKTNLILNYIDCKSISLTNFIWIYELLTQIMLFSKNDFL